jgi:hypothetical protein
MKAKQALDTAARQFRQETAKPKVLNCADVLKIEAQVEKMLFDGYPLPAHGVTLKVGAARSGKTILAVQEAVAIARGEALFDYYKVLEPGPVLIVEQDDPSGPASIKTILERNGVKASVPFFLVPRLPFVFGDALLEWLEEQIIKRALRLVVLDSYTSLRGSRSAGVDIAKVEQIELTRLDELAKRTKCSVVVIHHGSKSAAGLDWTHAAAGTYAMSMATEAQAHMSRFADLDGASTERLVRIRGRHSADAQIVLRFQKETLNFEFLLEGSAAELYPVMRQIHFDLGATPFGPKEFAEATGASRATAFRLMSRLRSAGALQRRGHGQYVLDSEMEKIFRR